MVASQILGMIGATLGRSLDTPVQIALNMCTEAVPYITAHRHHCPTEYN